MAQNDVLGIQIILLILAKSRGYIYLVTHLRARSLYMDITYPINMPHLILNKYTVALLLYVGLYNHHQFP
jgi:hypothetical protein